MSKTAESKPAPRASARGASPRSPARGNGTDSEQVTRLRVEVGRLDIEVHNIKENMATKSDIIELRADMQRMNAEMQAAMQTMNADFQKRLNEMQRWIIGTVLSGVGFLSVLIALIGVLLQIYS